MINVALVSSVARSALVGAVATKLVDTLVSTKINHKNDEKKWIRNTKFELFSKLTEEILIMDEENFETQSKQIKKQIAKIVLLVDDRVLTDKLELYLQHLILDKTNTYEKIQKQNHAVIEYLKKDIRKK